MTRIRRNPVGWLFVAPALFLLIVFLIYPTLWTIRLSFFGGPGFIPTRFVGLDNYVRLFTQDPYFFNGNNFPPTGTVINNIIWLFLFTSLVMLSNRPAQILFAYHLAHPDIRRRKGWWVTYFLSSLLWYMEIKNLIGRVAHIKEFMRERRWVVTPRTPAPGGTRTGGA